MKYDILLLLLIIFNFNWCFSNEILRTSTTTIINNDTFISPFISPDQDTSKNEFIYPGKKRKKRFIQFNLDSPLNVGILFVAPFTIVIPHFHVYQGRRITRSLIEFSAGSFDKPVIIDDNPAIQPYINKILNIFNLIEVAEYHCQLRAICEFASSPEEYSPLSNLILENIRDEEFSLIVELEDQMQKLDGNLKLNGTSLYRLFSRAETDGVLQGHSKCEESYGGQCPFETHQRLNMENIKFWSILSNSLGIKLQDDL